MIEYRKNPTMAECKLLAPRLRQPDIVECEAVHPHAYAALVRSTELSVESWTVHEGLETIAMCGMAIHEDIGMPWLLGTDRVYEFPYRLLRGGLKLLKAYEPQVTAFRQMVWAGNDASINYLNALGFRDVGSTRIQRTDFLIYERNV